ncbi:hypothetical protein IL306_013531 [Fusarium sp. DS 682]|nr:hypothetical protein IL306_013531 [Fusarium sp. DS 682]
MSDSEDSNNNTPNHEEGAFNRRSPLVYLFGDIQLPLNHNKAILRPQPVRQWLPLLPEDPAPRVDNTNAIINNWEFHLNGTFVTREEMYEMDEKIRELQAMANDIRASSERNLEKSRRLRICAMLFCLLSVWVWFWICQRGATESFNRFDINYDAFF